MAYLAQTTLTKAWVDLSDRLGRVAIPLPLFRSAQNPAASFLVAYEAWNERLDSEYDESGKKVRPFTVAELEKWTSVLAEQQALLVKLEAAYPKQVPQPAAAPPRRIEEQRVEGALPWWYWPLRVGAGVAAGYFAFKVLKPSRETAFGPLPEFAGVSRKK